MKSLKVSFGAIILAVGLMLAGCATYDSGYGFYYDDPYYYNYGYGYYARPYVHPHHEFGERHREFGRRPEWREHREHHEGGEHRGGGEHHERDEHHR